MLYCLGREKKRVGEGGQGLFTEGGGGGGGSSWSTLEWAEAALCADQSKRTLKRSCWRLIVGLLRSTKAGGVIWGRHRCCCCRCALRMNNRDAFRDPTANPSRWCCSCSCCCGVNTRHEAAWAAQSLPWFTVADRNSPSRSLPLSHSHSYPDVNYRDNGSDLGHMGRSVKTDAAVEDWLNTTNFRFSFIASLALKFNHLSFNFSSGFFFLFFCQGKPLFISEIKTFQFKRRQAGRGVDKRG